ncbi:hypothetical protein [Paenibacillus gansuensis]|uniref:DUF1292 domain-containing protein n=1 Tax=Paenibacillus gansuensis TaxID=306542 RepID=A0ABW5PFQ0_9BACL
MKIVEAHMTYNKEEGYVGQVIFELENHTHPYEITLQKSKKAKEWAYGLRFAGESGSEEELFAAEDLIEEDDELYDLLVETAKSKLEE